MAFMPSSISLPEFAEYKSLNNDYYCGILVYQDDYQKELAMHSCLRTGCNNREVGRFDPICRNKEDVFELPTIAMYLTLGNALRIRGVTFNKKKGEFVKR